MRPRFTLIVLILFASVVLIFALIISSPQQLEGGFSRKLLTGRIKLIRQWPIDGRKYYLAGTIGDTLFVANTLDCTYLIRFFGEGRHDSITLSYPESLHEETRTSVSAGVITTVCPNSFKVFAGTGRTLEHFNVPPRFFAEAVGISAATVMVRSIPTNKREYALGLLHNNSDGPHLDDKLLQKQIDGLFCTDGMLLFNDQLKVAVYTYYYRNEFFCMDTTASLLYRARTIDTISHSRISVSGLQSDNSLRLNSPARVVNDKTSTHGELLYVQSRVMADNESQHEFRQNAVVDIYNLLTGKYMNTFYIPQPKDDKLREFRVFNKWIFALYHHSLALYELKTN